MEYKLYCIDKTGHVVSSQDLRVADDLSALREAEKASGHHAIEIWQGPRRVAHVKLGNAPLNTTDRMSL